MVLQFPWLREKVIGIYVNPAVMSYPPLDEAFVTEPGSGLPLEDSNINVIICEYVVEHVEHLRQFAQEIDRVLNTSSWLCTLTPNRLDYVGIGTISCRKR